MYHALECLGCGEISFVDRIWADPGSFFGDAYVKEELFFPVSPCRLPPSWAPDLPTNIMNLLLEVYSAANYQLFNVATMGVRAVVDLTLNSLVGDIGGFEQKLKEAVKQGLIEQRYEDPLSSIIESGHAASHRGHTYDRKSFELIMSILEQLLHRIYIISKEEEELRLKSGLLRAATPKRTPKRPKHEHT